MARRTKHTYRGYVAGQAPQPSQERMFGAASLPLWSQTAPSGRVERFEPQPYVHPIPSSRPSRSAPATSSIPASLTPFSIYERNHQMSCPSAALKTM